MTIYIVNDLSRDFDKKSLVVSAVSAPAADINLSQIVQVLAMIGGVNWKEFEEDLQKQDWVDVGFLTIEEVLTIMSPWFPQAGIARGIIRLAQACVDSLPKGNEPFSLDKFLQGVLAVEGVDWEGLLAALKGDSPVMAALVTTDDLAKLIAPFMPQAALANGVLQVLIEIAKNTHGIDNSEYPGYHWDALYGWVPDSKGE